MALFSTIRGDRWKSEADNEERRAKARRSVH